MLIRMSGRYLRALAARSFFFICLLCCSLFQPRTASAQYYRAPKPVSQASLRSLTERLGSAGSAQEQLRVLLLLSNLYYSKPLQLTDDLKRSLAYSEQAITKSRSLKDKTSLDSALLLSAYIQLALWRFPEAENILPQLSGKDRLDLLLALSYFYTSLGVQEKDRLKKSLDYALQALQLSKDLADVEAELIALKDIAIVHVMQNDPAAEKELLALLDRYRAAHSQLIHYPYFYLADYYNDKFRPEKAADFSLMALESIKRSGDHSNAGDVYLLHSVICNKNDHYKDALQYGERAIAFYRQYPGLVKLSNPFITEQMDLALQKLGRHKEALAYMLKMKRMYPPQNMKDSMVYERLIGHGYRELKQYDKAVPYFKRYEELSRRSKTHEYAANVNFGQLYVESHEYQKARPYLYKALPEENDLPLGARLHLRYMLYLTDSATGNYLDALHHRSFLNDQAESRKRIETDNALKKWQVAYGTQKREELLKLKNQNIELLTLRSLAQQEKIERADLIRNLIAGGFILVLIILSLIIFQFRQKQRTNRLVMAKSKQIDQKNVLLQKLLTEKEWLLKEVHHRVKNNLHTIFCLLESQAVFLQDDALAAVETSRNRIYAMSLLHQKLYQSDNIKVVDMAHYFNEFLVYLRRSFDLEERNIRIDLDIAALRFDISIAIPLGLILNEAVTNAIKYAFTGRENGVIAISLKQHGQQVELMIGDNGIGLPAATPVIQNSLGIELMRGLSLDIGAEINFEVTDGTKISVTFMVDEHSSVAEVDRKLA
jgi:two-component sensor histidine kinase